MFSDVFILSLLMTEIIQSNVKYSTLRQTAMNNIKQSNPDLSDSFLLTCKVTLVTTYVKLPMSNYWRAIVENQKYSIFSFNLILFFMLNSGNSKMI